MIAIELQQLLADFAHGLDACRSRGSVDFYADDGQFAVGDDVQESWTAIRRVYDQSSGRTGARAEPVVAVGIHSFVNVRIHVEDTNNAVAYFTNVNYAGEGQPSALGASSPAAITSCEMSLRGDSHGVWRIKDFAGKPIFVGEVPGTKSEHFAN